MLKYYLMTIMSTLYYYIITNTIHFVLLFIKYFYSVLLYINVERGDHRTTVVMHIAGTFSNKPQH